MKKFFLLILFFLFNILYLKAQWVKLNNIFPVDLAVHGDSILIPTLTYYVMFSSDNGENWKVLDYIKKQNIIPEKIAFNDNTIIIANVNNNEDTLIYVSHDFGYTWKGHELTWKYNNADYPISCINDIIFYNNVIFIAASYGLFKSIDFGDNWELLNVCDPNIPVGCNEPPYIMLCIAAKDSVIYVSEKDFGIFESSDMGVTWKFISKKLFENNTSIFIQQIAITDSAIIALFGDVAAFTLNNGVDWNIGHIFNKSIVDTSLYYILACDNNLYVTSNIGVFFSSDFGINWFPITSGLECLSANHIAKNKRYIFIGTGRSYGQGGGGFYRAKIKGCEIDTTSTEVEEIPPPVPFGLSISPNPASDLIEIKGLVENENWEIFNVLGEKILVGQTFLSVHDGQGGQTGMSNLPGTIKGGQTRMSNLLKVDVSAFPPGVYFLRAGGKACKFIKLGVWN